MLGLPAKCSFVASCSVCDAFCMESQPSAVCHHFFRQSVAASSHVARTELVFVNIFMGKPEKPSEMIEPKRTF